MKPINFKHANTKYAENQPQYGTLPTLKIEGPEGHVVSCWKLTWKERFQVFVFGRVWMNLMSFNKPLTPSFLATNRKEVFSVPEDEISLWMKIKNLLK